MSTFDWTTKRVLVTGVAGFLGRRDARKVRQKLGRKPKASFTELITMMVKADDEDVRATLGGRAPRE